MSTDQVRVEIKDGRVKVWSITAEYPTEQVRVRHCCGRVYVTPKNEPSPICVHCGHYLKD